MLQMSSPFQIKKTETETIPCRHRQAQREREKKASRVLDQEKNINRDQAEEGKRKRRIHSLLISSAIIRSAYSTRIINRSEGSTQGQKVNFQDVASS